MDSATIVILGFLAIMAGGVGYYLLQWYADNQNQTNRKHQIDNLSSKYNMSSTEVENELNSIFNNNKNLEGSTGKQVYFDSNNKMQTKDTFVEDWYKDSRKLGAIDELMEKKAKEIHYTEEKRISEAEYRKKLNENIDKQNEILEMQKEAMRPWECKYCGNTNPGSEYTCLKCGASR